MYDGAVPPLVPAATSLSFSNTATESRTSGKLTGDSAADCTGTDYDYIELIFQSFLFPAPFPDRERCDGDVLLAAEPEDDRTIFPGNM